MLIKKIEKKIDTHSFPKVSNFRKAVAFLFLFFLSLESSLAQIPHFRQHPLSIENAEQLELNCLAQTSDGVLWIGSNRGLIRYNGLQMQLFPRHLIYLPGTSRLQSHSVLLQPKPIYLMRRLFYN